MSARTPDPDADFIRQTASAFQRSRILLTAFDLGIFTELSKGPASAAYVAAEAKADERAVDRLLCALCVLGLVEKKDGLYANAPAAAAYLVKGGERYMGELGHMSDLFGSWATLTEAVRIGGSVRAHSFEDQDEEAAETFITAMHNIAKPQAPVLAEKLDLSGARRLLDVGGGSGVYSIALARKYPDLSCTVFDVPSVRPIALRHAAEAGLEGRVDAVEGDYMNDSLGSGYDAALFSAIVHINGPKENAWLMKKAFDALNPGGKVIVRDFIMDEDRTSPARGAIFALNMLVNAKRGDSYTAREIEQWLAAAGFKDVSRIDLNSETSAMVGVKPG